MDTKELVLVTGGSGLVGRCLQELVSDGQSPGLRSGPREFVFLSSRDGDLVNYEEARRVFETYRPQHVIHLAAKVGGLYANMADTEGQFYECNAKMNDNVLELCHQFRVGRAISCMSTCVFPDQVELPLDESKLHLGPPHESNFGYAMSKRRLDLLNREYNNKTGAYQSIFFSIVPTNIYGPHDNFHLDDSHVLAGLIHKAYRSCLAAQSAGQSSAVLQVCGSGEPLRQFIYAPDLARLIVWALDEFHDKQEPLVIMGPSGREEVSIRRAAELVCREFGRRFGLAMSVRLDTSKSDGQLRKTASNEKLARMRANLEFTPIELGLRATIDWFCRHYPQVRGSIGS